MSKDVRPNHGFSHFGTTAGMRAAAILVASTIATLPATLQADGLPPLGAYRIDAGGISVSGVSSGGFMAHQVHVAHSQTVMGAAVFAGGPYCCAGKRYPYDLWITLNSCLSFPLDLVPFLGPPSVESSIEATEEEASNSAIDPPANLRSDRVYLFSGRADELVPRKVMDVLDAYYRHYVAAGGIAYETGVDAGHAMVTDGYGNAECSATAPPHINDCGFDAAGALLSHIYGALRPRAEPDPAALHAFDQAPFADGDPAAISLAARGHVYVPKACAEGTACRLHVAFHGCRQTEEHIGDAFFAHAGYNGWAEANGIILLYPQTTAQGDIPHVWPNPQACWDWWGYTGGDYARKSGPQIRAVKRMIDRLIGK